MLKFDLESSAELPLNRIIKIRAETVCWFIQRKKWRNGKRGLPSRLKNPVSQVRHFPVDRAAGCKLRQPDTLCKILKIYYMLLLLLYNLHLISVTGEEGMKAVEI